MVQRSMQSTEMCFGKKKKNQNKNRKKTNTKLWFFSSLNQLHYGVHQYAVNKVDIYIVAIMSKARARDVVLLYFNAFFTNAKSMQNQLQLQRRLLCNVSANEWKQIKKCVKKDKHITNYRASTSSSASTTTQHLSLTFSKMLLRGA